MRKTPISKVNHLSRKGVIIAEDTDTALLNVDKNNKITRINRKSTNNQINHSINSGKRIKTYQTKKYMVITALVNHSQIIQITSYRGRSPEQRNSRNFSQNRYSRSNSQDNQYRNNYSRSNSNRTAFFDTSSYPNSRNRHYSNDRSRNSSYNRNRKYSNNRNRSYSNNINQRYQNNRSRNISYNRSNYQRNNNNYYNRSRNNSQNRNPN